MNLWHTLQDRWWLGRLLQVQFDQVTQQATEDASRRYRVPADLIAGILADERARLALTDVLQDRWMRLSLRLSPRGAAALRGAATRLCRRELQTFSLGRAQMKGTTLVLLGERGYLVVPRDPVGQLRLLLDDGQAPVLVAACLRATADTWQAGGVRLIDRPDLLGTLYSLGITGRRGLHPHPQPSARGRLIAAYMQRRAAAARQAAQPGHAAG